MMHYAVHIVKFCLYAGATANGGSSNDQIKSSALDSGYDASVKTKASGKK